MYACKIYRIDLSSWRLSIPHPSPLVIYQQHINDSGPRIRYQLYNHHRNIYKYFKCIWDTRLIKGTFLFDVHLEKRVAVVERGADAGGTWKPSVSCVVSVRCHSTRWLSGPYSSLSSSMTSDLKNDENLRFTCNTSAPQTLHITITLYVLPHTRLCKTYIETNLHCQREPSLRLHTRFTGLLVNSSRYCKKLYDSLTLLHFTLNLSNY